MDREHQGYGPHHRYAGDEQVLRPVMGQLSDVEELCRHPAHEVAGAVFVVEAKGQGLQVGKQVPADVRLHQHAEGMPPEANHILQARPQQIGRHQQDSHGEEGPVAAVRYQLIQAHPADIGKGQINQRYGQGAGHVQQEQPQVGPEVAEKYAKKALLVKIAGGHGE